MAVAWLKAGKESAAVAQQEKKEAEQRKAEMGKMWRFFLAQDEDNVRITFVDGELSSEGYLLPPRYYEHNIQQGGKWGNYYVCPEKTHPESEEHCPLCEQGDRPSLVALFTVIDHRQFKSKDGSKTYQDTPKILAAKPITFELLNKIAIKRGGLSGCTFDVMRTGDKAAAVGSMFDFVSKEENIEALQDAYIREFKDKNGKTVTKSSFVPADYENEIIFRNEAELRGLGFGKSVTKGTPGGFHKTKAQATADEVDEHL